MALALIAVYVFAWGEVETWPLVTLADAPPCHVERVDEEGHRRILRLRAFSSERAWYQEGWHGPVEIYV